MTNADLVNLTLLARTAFEIMCFEHYVLSVYPDADFTPAAELLWRIVDGSEPAAEAAKRAMEMIPEKLFSYGSYAEYRAAGHSGVTEEQYRTLTGILNSKDRNLNILMKLICQTALEYEGTEVKPGAPETLLYLDNAVLMLKARAVRLPELNLLQKYAFSQQALADAQRFNWRGEPIDPAPLSLLGITSGKRDVPEQPEDAELVPLLDLPDEMRNAVSGAAQAETENQASDVPQNKKRTNAVKLRADSAYKSGRYSFDFAKENIKHETYSGAKPVKPVLEANGCKWEIIEQAEGCIITRCMNHAYQKTVTVPSELNGKPVTEIDDNVFLNTPDTGCRAIETVILPDTVRRIGNGFFSGCTALRQVRLPAALESIGHEAFRGASKLESLAVGNFCRTIGDYFCADAVALQSVTIGAAITYMGRFSFYNTPAMSGFRCDGMLRELGYGSFWMNRWADKQIFAPEAEMLRFCKDDALLYRYVRLMPPPRLFFGTDIKYVYDFAFGGDAWNSGEGIRDIYLPGAEKIGVHAFKKTPNATVHLSASRMKAAYGSDYAYTLSELCKPAKAVFDQM